MMAGGISASMQQRLAELDDSYGRASTPSRSRSRVSVRVAAVSDKFHFDAGFGHYSVTDFPQNADDIVFHKDLFDGFTEPLAASARVGSDVLITADSEESVLLKNVAFGNLKRDDFHFTST